jgi:phosphoribosylformimino-5-aminoimidazole carboxamide ribotide isomerase
MNIIPAVDIKKGKCVRLFQGKMDNETVYSDSPLSMAKKWENKGAKFLHIVDLDGAINKRPENIESIRDIVKNINIPIQLGGGIRDIKTIEFYFNIGIKKVIIGTEAVKNIDFVKDASERFPYRIIIGIDAKNGMVATEGWTEISDIDAVSLVRKLEKFKIAGINFTDIHRDGTQTGPNIKETKMLAKSTLIPIIASGGVSNIDDIKNIALLEKYGVEGVIIGRALYDGSFTLTDALNAVQN